MGFSCLGDGGDARAVQLSRIFHASSKGSLYYDALLHPANYNERMIMHALLKTAVAMMLGLMLVACAGTSAPSKREMILGSWQADFGGQTIVLTYGEAEISVDAFGVSFPYEWLDDNTIKLDAMGQEVVSTVEFVSPNEMIQRSDQGEQTLRRVTP